MVNVYNPVPLATKLHVPPELVVCVCVSEPLDIWTVLPDWFPPPDASVTVTVT